MPRSFGDTPKVSATDVAAALMDEEVAPEAVAPESDQQEETPEVAAQPERGSRRDASGRFVPRAASVPSEPEAESADTPVVVEPTQDLAAELERQRAENARLRNTYANNTQAQREALEAARREAAELRGNQQAERERLLADARAEVEAIPENDPRKGRAERELAAIERQEAQRMRQEIDQEREAQVTAQREQATREADLAARVGSWGVVEAYAATYGHQLGLPAEEAQAALDALKTPELAILFRTMAPQELVNHVRNVVGNRLHDDLTRRAASRTEANRKAVVAEGAHDHPRSPVKGGDAPAYTAYTRENKTGKLGRRAAAEAIMAGILDG